MIYVLITGDASKARFVNFNEAFQLYADYLHMAHDMDRSHAQTIQYVEGALKSQDSAGIILDLSPNDQLGSVMLAILPPTLPPD